MVGQFYHSGGDKHRLTVINISRIFKWFDTNAEPEPGKDFVVLLVFCEYHAKLEDIDDEHKWARDVEIPTCDGPVYFKKGQYTKLLHAYVETRKRSLDKSRFNSLRVWGQRKAWCDSQVCVQLSDLLFQEYGQALVICDCLGARWSSHSLLAHWGNQQILGAYAPGSTSTLQEPDTHEHAQLKAEIRHVKAELHFDLEQECVQKNKDRHKLPWGPAEFIHILNEGVKRFAAKNPQVPLQGMIENHILAVRPSMEGETLRLKLLSDCTDETTVKMMSRPECRRYPPSKGACIFKVPRPLCDQGSGQKKQFGQVINYKGVLTTCFKALANVAESTLTWVPPPITARSSTQKDSFKVLRVPGAMGETM